MKKWILILIFFIVTVPIYAKTLTIKPYKIYIYDAETKEPLKNVRIVSAIEITNWINLFIDSIDNYKCYLEEYYTDENGCLELPLRKYHRIALGFKSIYEFLYINLQLKEKSDVSFDFHGYNDFHYHGERRVSKLYRPQQDYEAWSIHFLEPYNEKYIRHENVHGGTSAALLYPEDGNLIIYLDKIQNKSSAPQDGIDIKSGEHKLYSYGEGEETGNALLTQEGDSYNLSFKGKGFCEHAYPYTNPVYDDIEIKNAKLQQTSIKEKASHTDKKVLLGDYEGYKIIITKELEDYAMPKSIDRDFREYYYLLVVPNEVFDKDFARPYKLVFDICMCNQGLYKAIFYEDIDK